MTSLTKQLQSAEAGSRRLDALLCKRFRPDLFNRHWSDAKAMQPKGASDDEVMRALLVRRGFPRVTSCRNAIANLIDEVVGPIRVSMHEHIGGASVEIVLDGDREFAGHSLATVPLAGCLALLSAAAVEGSDVE